jgi:hypothetical protein
MIAGWQQFFRIQWDATKRGDREAVEGFITNIWGFTALRMQLLVTGFDTSGTSLGQVIAWGPSEIDPWRQDVLHRACATSCDDLRSRNLRVGLGADRRSLHRTIGAFIGL